MPDNSKDIAVLQVRVDALDDCSNRIKESLKDAVDHKTGASEVCREVFVTRERFWPIEKLVYGVVGLILIAVAGAIIALVVKR